MYRPRTSSEINQFHIEKTLKKLEKGLIHVQDCNLNKRFDRLKRDNILLYEDLYPKYIAIVRKLNHQTFNISVHICVKGCQYI